MCWLSQVWKAGFAPRDSLTVVYNNATVVPACLLQPVISTNPDIDTATEQTPQTSSHITCDPDFRFDSRQVTPAPSSRCRASLLRAAAVASRYPVKIRGRPFSGPWQHVTGPLEPPKLISFRVHPTTASSVYRSNQPGARLTRARVPGEHIRSEAAHKSAAGNESRTANL
jgi:hypothetical protein